MRLLLAFLLSLSAAAATHAAGLAEGGPVDITSKQLDVEQKKGLATFTGDVVLTQGEFSLTAPKLVANYADKSGKQGDIQSIEATGGVTITRPAAGGISEKAVGDTAIYNPVTKQVQMNGAVTLTRGPSQLSGDKLIYDMASGNARVTNSKGPVRARFVPPSKPAKPAAK